MVNLKAKIKKLTQIKQSAYLLKMNLKKLKTLDSGYFRGKNHFEEDGTQN